MTESTLEAQRTADGPAVRNWPLCPRCHTGQMLLRHEVEGLELHCVQCGHSVNKRALLAARQPTVKAA